jgi:hypothetical protein
LKVLTSNQSCTSSCWYMARKAGVGNFY